MREPAAQFFAPVSRVQPLDAKAKLGQRHGANVKLIKRLDGDKCQYFRLGL
jgi:hypothetical protein